MMALAGIELETLVSLALMFVLGVVDVNDQ